MHPPSSPDTEPRTGEHGPRLPGRTTPTWEMELLLSGATVFTLWQVVGWLAPFMAELLPRLDAQLGMISGVLYVYLATAVIMLGLAFALHLALRAYWVGLVGMHSVFPAGLRPERLRAGPIAREVLQRRWVDMDTAIERADNRATVVFGLGVGVAAVVLPITLMVAVVYGLVLAGCWLAGRLDLIPVLFLVGVGAVLAPFFLVTGIDRWWGERLAPGSRLRRALAACFSLYARIGMSRETNPLVALYASHVGERRSSFVVMGMLLLSVTLAAYSLSWQRNDLGPGNYGRFPASAAGLPGTVDGEHYASLQEPDESPNSPFLPAPVLRGRYAPLVVPFVPSLHRRHLAGCEAGLPEDRAGARQALLDCYAALHEVRLDGQPLPVKPDFYLDPARNLRGLVYMLPLADMPPGRHELEVRLPDPREPGSKANPPRPERIPFWR